MLTLLSLCVGLTVSAAGQPYVLSEAKLRQRSSFGDDEPQQIHLASGSDGSDEMVVTWSTIGSTDMRAQATTVKYYETSDPREVYYAYGTVTNFTADRKHYIISSPITSCVLTLVLISSFISCVIHASQLVLQTLPGS